MNLEEAIVEGTLRPDGPLELDRKPNLTPGRVTVRVQSLPQLPVGDPFWEMMKEIWAGQQARGHVPRSVEEVETERRQMREDWEERQQAIERLQEESRRLREKRP
jgi:hypothetical protein